MIGSTTIPLNDDGSLPDVCTLWTDLLAARTPADFSTVRQMADYVFSFTMLPAKERPYVSALQGARQAFENLISFREILANGDGLILDQLDRAND